MTAANQGGSRIGVSSANLSLTNGLSVPLIEHLPVVGSRPLPAILEPHERSVMWLDFQDMRSTLHPRGIGIVAVVATLNDGSEVRQAVSSIWRKL